MHHQEEDKINFKIRSSLQQFVEIMCLIANMTMFLIYTRNRQLFEILLYQLHAMVEDIIIKLTIPFLEEMLLLPLSC